MINREGPGKLIKETLEIIHDVWTNNIPKKPKTKKKKFISQKEYNSILKQFMKVKTIMEPEVIIFS
jgi:hypothetical protein